MKFRHELKHEISQMDMLVLRSRLRAVLQPESHGTNGVYHIRSLYFDDARDTALREKINGVNKREKIRIRYYDRDVSFLRLEKKRKINGLCSKEWVQISAVEAARIVSGDLEFMREDDRPFLREVYVKMKNKGLKPKTIVDYTREAYVFPAGNVRVTIDHDIRTGLTCTDFLNPDCVTIPAGDVPVILEVKWDEFLPDIVRDAVGLKDRRASAFSKYALCRRFG